MRSADTMFNPNRVEAAAGRYRADIDGLRAIAVVPVVLYHYHVAPFTGGFVGVDIFFVISGFLITSLIYAEMREQRFSIVNFYERRVRRIFPALFAMLAFTLAPAFLLLFPDDLKHYTDSLLGTAVFASNFIFWSEAGYFDTAASLKPLLHTWSLAVEEQFYLIFPAILLLVHSAVRRKFLFVVVAIFAISLALSIWGVRHAPDSTFYLLPFRMWELMLGAILAVGKLPLPGPRWARETLAALGITLMAVSVIVFTRDTPFPGEAALLPCLGAALIIHAGSGARTFTGAVLSTRPMVWTGLISYSLYLWHWPLLVFARYETFGELAWWQIATLIALSFVAATLMYHYVERPFRGKHSRISRQWVFRLAGVSMAATLALGAVGWFSNGLPQRFDAETQAILRTATENNIASLPCFNLALNAVRQGRLCPMGTQDQVPPSFLLWGDSHAGMLEAEISEVMAAHKRAGVYALRHTCAPLLDVNVSGSSDCRAFNNAMLKLARQPNISEIILVAHWAHYSEGVAFGEVEAHNGYITDDASPGRSLAEDRPVFTRGLERTIKMLAGMGKKIVIIASVPEIGWRVPETLARIKTTHSGFDIRPTLRQHLERQAFVFAQFERLRKEYGVTVVYPDKVLCAPGLCEVERAGRPIYQDHTHLAPAGARLLTPLLDAAL